MFQRTTRFVLAAALSVTCIAGFAQRRREEAQPAPQQPAVTPAASQAQHTPAADNSKKIYDLAIRYRDPIVAIQAVYMQLAANPEDAALKDSLATLYFVSRSYPQALAVANELLAKDPNNRKMLELAAISEQSLGRAKEALEAYERLYANSRSVYHLYQVAVLQYSLQRVGECLNSLGLVIVSPDSEKEKVVVTMQQGQQEVPLRAAAYNVRGVIMRDQKNLPEARNAFNEAIRLFPDFVLAKNNLAELNKAATPQQPAPAPARGR